MCVRTHIASKCVKATKRKKIYCYCLAPINFSYKKIKKKKINYKTMKITNLLKNKQKIAILCIKWLEKWLVLRFKHMKMFLSFYTNNNFCNSFCMPTKY